MGKKIPTTIKDQELVAQRRGEIIDVATRLFLERGFHNTSIRDIARACPFNLASLYMYVSSKEDILFLVAQQLIDEKAKAMSDVEIREDDPAASFRTALRSYCRIVHNYRPHMRLLYRDLDVLSPQRREMVMASLSTVTGVFEKIVRTGIAKGYLGRTRAEARRIERALSLPSMVAAHPRAAQHHRRTSTNSSTCRATSVARPAQARGEAAAEGQRANASPASSDFRRRSFERSRGSLIAPDFQSLVRRLRACSRAPCTLSATAARRQSRHITVGLPVTPAPVVC